MAKGKNTELNLALLALIIFTLSVAVSIILTPNYDFFFNYLSELGVGENAIIFNAGVVITAVLLIPFFSSVYQKNKMVPQIITILGIASMLFFAGVGIFPLTDGVLHTYAATMFFFTITLVMFFVFVEFFAKVFFKNKKNLCTTVMFLFAASSIIPIAFNTALFVFQNPFWQKIAVAGIVIWAIAFAIIRKTKWDKATC